MSFSQLFLATSDRNADLNFKTDRATVFVWQFRDALSRLQTTNIAKHFHQNKYRCLIEATKPQRQRYRMTKQLPFDKCRGDFASKAMNLPEIDKVIFR